MLPGVSSSSVSISSIPQARHSSSFDSEHLLYATYFDIGIIRTLFSPLWLTDGYIWCLEYLHKRLGDILDMNIYPGHLKSLSILHLNERNYFNEQITNKIFEKQTMMISFKQQPLLLNKTYKNFSRKNSEFFFLQKKEKKYSFFLSSIISCIFDCFFSSKIRYIDEDRIEHLDLANDHFNLSLSPSKTSHLALTDPTLLLFKSPMISNHQSITNLSSMKPYSSSDSEINYKSLEEISEAQGSSGYINQNGTINFSIILAGIHALICKEYHLKVYELAMHILDVLFGLNVISSIEDERLLKNQKDKEFMEEWFEQIGIKENEKFQLAIDIILR